MVDAGCQTGWGDTQEAVAKASPEVTVVKAVNSPGPLAFAGGFASTTLQRAPDLKFPLLTLTSLCYSPVISQ